VADLLLDTNVFVDHLRGAHRIKLRAGDSIHYSTITRCELFAGPAEQEPAVRNLLGPFRELPVDTELAGLAGQIRRETRILTPDALIAATALVHGLSLVTGNRRDFDPVPNLRVRSSA